MTRRLLLSYLGLALLILAVLEIPLGVIASHREHEEATSQVSRDAAGLAVESEEDLAHHDVVGLDLLLRTYRAKTGAEIAVVGLRGATLAADDPDHDHDARVNRRRIALALRGRSTTVVTSVDGTPTAVAAVPIGNAHHPLGAVLLLTPVAAYTDHAFDTWLALAIFAVVVLVLTSLVGLALARSLARPLADLERTFTRLGAGELASRADTERGPQEMRSLAEQFNHMAERLSELIEAQTRFVADASHQLRSPLTAMRLRLENLEADLGGGAGDSLAAVGREVLRLSRLVDGLLTLSRTNAGPPELVPVDVDELLAERCGSWVALVGERGIELVRVASTGPVVVPLVPGDLDQIVDNLLANALDASPAGTTITVSLRSGRRGRLALHVVDQGHGLSEEERRRAFDRFWQGPGRRGGHSGLGLAIVRQLAHRNGLEVELLPAPGGGLDAVVHLRGRPDPAAAEVAPADAEVAAVGD